MRRALLLSVMLSTWALGAEVKPADNKPADNKPADVKPATSKPAEKGTAPKPFLGVRFDESAVSLDQEPGMPISEVVTGSTAQSLGIEAGDRLLTLNGKATERTDDLSVILAGAKVGDPVSIEYIRGGSKTLVQGALSERPKPATLVKDVDRLN
jgi:S1-C subfamily serine protease